jgi:predicted PurR-regulated permease PerM
MEQSNFQKDLIAAAIRIGLLVLLLYVSFKIVQPFMVVVVWGAIIATALYPLHRNFTRRFNGNKKLSAVLITLIALAVLIVPSYLLGDSMIGTAQTLGDDLADGSFTIPQPAESVAEWPVIGEKHIEAYTARHQESIKTLSKTLLSAAAAAVKSVFMFIFSIIIAGALLNYAEGCRDSLYRLFERLVPNEGVKLVNSAGATVQSVAKGVLGTAAIQTVLGTIGMLVVGVPGVGLWAVLVLMVAIVQLPPILILGPVAAYVFSVEPTWIATIFLVYSLIVSSADAVLKPMLLGRGVELPMLVILLGAIGGMVLSGIIGLFTGAVFLAIAYQVYMLWLEDQPVSA